MASHSAAMKLLFQIGDQVNAKIDGFEPFPATVESVRLNESDCSVFYYVRFLGASEVVPLNAENLEPLKNCDQEHHFNYNDKEMQKESKLRVDAVLGAEDDIPEVLMNFVTVDSDFEEVSEDTVKRLGLYSITLTPRMVQSLDNIMSKKNDELVHGSVSDEDFVDIEVDDDSSRVLRLKSQADLQIPCTKCHRKFKSWRAVKTHQRLSQCGVSHTFELGNKTAIPISRKLNHVEPEEKSVTANLNKEGEEVVVTDRSKWVSRSASGYYPCRLCFRKFRSLGEVQLHISLHKPIQKKRPDRSPVSDDYSDSESVDDMKNSKHCSMERVRRAELATKFAMLAKLVDLPEGTPKVKTLEVAKSNIEKLEKEAEDQDQQIAHLQDMHGKLQARFLQLEPVKR